MLFLLGQFLMNTEIWMSLTGLVFLILLSAFFSASETAMMALNRYRLKHLVRQGHKKALKAQNLLKRPDRLLGVILLGNTFSNIFASALCTMVAAHFFKGPGILISMALLTVCILIFSEVMPKTVAALNPETIGFRLVVLLKILQLFLYPIVFILNFISNGLFKLLGINPQSKHNEALSPEEIRSLVYDAKSKIQKRQHHMLLGVLGLEQATIADVLTPRSKIYAINLEDPLSSITEQIVNSPYSKIPVYRNDIDHIVGIISLKQAIRLMNQGPISLKSLESIIEAAYFVPEQLSLQKLLIHFQKKKERFALIVNEYGDIEGLATLEDILEEIIGDYLHSLPSQQSIQKINAHHYVVSGNATIRDINRQLDIHLPTGGAKTLGGLILEQMQTLPQEKIPFKLQAQSTQSGTPGALISMVIEKIEGKVIESVKISL